MLTSLHGSHNLGTAPLNLWPYGTLQIRFIIFIIIIIINIWKSWTNFCDNEAVEEVNIPNSYVR